MFFTLAFLFAQHPEKLSKVLGRFMGPLLLVLIAVLFIACLIHGIGTPANPMGDYSTNQIARGFLDGYQTMDLLASLAFGIIIAETIHELGVTDDKRVAFEISRSGVIAVLAILEIGQNRGDFRRQMTRMMLWVAMYALVYALFIDPVYGILQLFAGLTIPLLKRYHGTRGAGRGMKYLFYLYYPAHLFLCGLVRILLYGNVGVMVGGQ